MNYRFNVSGEGEDMERSQIIESLRNYKIENRLTDTLISDRMGVPRSTVSAWIRGTRSPSIVASAIIEKFIKEDKANKRW